MGGAAREVKDAGGVDCGAAACSVGPAPTSIVGSSPEGLRYIICQLLQLYRVHKHLLLLWS